MKYGLLYYKDTDNIGDDIQTYAQERFLPRIDYLVDRENLELFIPNRKEKVKLIMNAWYVHDIFNFNISPYIEPLYISMFLKKVPYKGGITVGTDYLNNNLLESFKKCGPVGTRDNHTKKILDKLEIPNYFSGCMTLTLNKLPNVLKQDYIVTVGLTDKEISYIKKNTKYEVKKFIQDVPRGSFANESWEKRKKRVEDTLRLYQGARMVITTKLHCSLPCLALGTPVLLLYDTSFPENKDRIGTFLPYLNYIKREKLFSSEINFDNPKRNSTKYLKLREELEKRCLDFINNSDTKEEGLPNTEDYTKYLEQSKNMRMLPVRLLGELQKIYEKECIKSSKMYDEIEELNYKYKHLEEEYIRIIEENKYLDKRLNNTIDFKLRKIVKKILGIK